MKTKRQGSYTVKEAAAVLKLHPNTVYKMKDQGVLKPIPLGVRSIRFPKSAIDALLDQGKPS